LIDINESGGDYVAWCWRAGAGTTSTNTDGSINSVVSVNQDAGFSIVSYTGTGSAGNVGHGLNKVPSWIIVKQRTGTESWPVYHSALGATEYMDLNGSAGVSKATTRWNDTEPTSTVFLLPVMLQRMVVEVNISLTVGQK
jgi:hypothetical protein